MSHLKCYHKENICNSLNVTINTEIYLKKSSNYVISIQKLSSDPIGQVSVAFLMTAGHLLKGIQLLFVLAGL